MPSYVVLLAAALLFLVQSGEAADAAWRWPWEVRQHHPRQHRSIRRHYFQVRVEPPAAPVDCASINEAVRELRRADADGARLARALRLSTRKQRETIAKCGGQQNGDR
jgi:hypothetical protein